MPLWETNYTNKPPKFSQKHWKQRFELKKLDSSHSHLLRARPSSYPTLTKAKLQHNFLPVARSLKRGRKKKKKTQEGGFFLGLFFLLYLAPIKYSRWAFRHHYHCCLVQSFCTSSTKGHNPAKRSGRGWCRDTCPGWRGQARKAEPQHFHSNALHDQPTRNSFG